MKSHEVMEPSLINTKMDSKNTTTIIKEEGGEKK